MIEVPCKNCDNKGCGEYHSKCDRYQQFIKDKEEERKKLSLDKETCRARKYIHRRFL